MKKILLTVGILFIMLSVYGEDVILENSKVAFRFSNKFNFSLKDILNKETGRYVDFDAGKESSIWEMNLLNGYSSISTARSIGGGKVAMSQKDGGTEMTVTWENMAVNDGIIKVVMTIFLPDDESIARCSLSASVSGKSAPWIKSVRFPMLHGIKSLGDDYLLTGEFLGRIVRNPTQNLPRIKIFHPGKWSMQFAAFHGSELLYNGKTAATGNSDVNGFYRGPADDETGLFISAADGKGYAKEIEIYSAEKLPDSFNIKMENYPSFDFWPPTKKERADIFTYEMPYKVMLGTFSGGTGKACSIYRQWAIRQDWMKNGPIRKQVTGDNSISPKTLECAFWGKVYREPGKIVPELAPLREYFRVPMNAHWCCYSISEFENNNMEYTPVDPYLREAVKDLKDMGFGIAPYTCCAVWDMDTESWEKYGMSRAAAVAEGNSPYVWLMHNRQPNAWMNPASPLWREKFNDLALKIFQDWRLNGEYLDVMSCVSQLCFDDRINSPNGGNYWVEGNRKLLAEIRKNICRITPSSFLTTEGFTEDYIDLIDAFLTLDIGRYGWAENNRYENFPLLSQIYHDYMIPFGTDCTQQLPPDSCRWQMGLSFIWGIQLMYSSNVFLKPETKQNGNDQYMRELVRAWHQAGWKFLCGGLGIETAMVSDGKQAGNAPVAVVSNPVSVNGGSIFLKRIKWTGPSVPGSTWTATDGTSGITITNITDKDSEAEIIIDAKKLQAEGRTIWRSWPSVEKIKKLSDRESIRVNVPASSAMIFEIRDDSPPIIRSLEEITWKFVSASKDGSFEEMKNNSKTLWGCTDSIVKNTLNDGNTMSLISQRTNLPRHLNKNVEWGTKEGMGLPRNPEDKPFYLLTPTSFSVDCNAETFIRFNGGIVSGTLVMKETGSIYGPGNAVIIVAPQENKKSSLHPSMYKKKAKLQAGNYRFAAWIPDEDVPEPDNKRLRNSLALLSTQCADKAEKILRNRITSDQANKCAIKLLAASNAMTYVATGAQSVNMLEHDWVLPFVPWNMKFKVDCGYGSIKASELVPIRDDLKQYLSITPGLENLFSLKVVSDKAVENLVPILFKADISYLEDSFKTTDLVHIGIDRPLIAETVKGGTVVSNVSPGAVARSAILVKNVSPYDLDISIGAELPDGWSIAHDFQDGKFKLNAFEKREIPIILKTAEKTDNEKYGARVYLNYTDNPETRIFEEFRINMDIGRNMVPAGIDINSTDTNWLPVCRNSVKIAIFTGKTKKIKFIAFPFSPSNNANRTLQFFDEERISQYLDASNTKGKEIKWRLLDLNMIPVASGIIKSGEAYKQLEINVKEDGLYYLVCKGDFFKIKINTPHKYGVMAWGNNPFAMFTAIKQEPIKMYFYVPQGAKTFELSGSDGGPLEPVQLRISGPDDKTVFVREGRWLDDGWFKIDVPHGLDGTIWSMEIIATEDFRFEMKGDVTPCLSPVKNSVLILLQ